MLKAFQGLGKYFTKKYYFQLSLSYLILTVAALCKVFIPGLFTKQVIDLISAKRSIDQLYLPTILHILSIIFAAFLFPIGHRLIAHVFFRVAYSFREDVFHHLLSLDQSFYQKFHTGDLLNRTTADIDNLRFNLANITSKSAFIFSELIVPVVAIFAISWQFGIFMVVIMVSTLILMVKFAHVIGINTAKVQGKQSLLSAKIQENLSNMRLVKGYTLESRQINEFKTLNSAYKNELIHLSRSSSVALLLPTLIPKISFFVLFIFMGAFIILNRGNFTLGTIVQVNIYMIMAVIQLDIIGSIVDHWQKGRANWFRIEEIFKIKPKINNPICSKDAEYGDIEFSNINLEINGRSLLKNINFKILKGQIIGITGPVGAGKSLIGALLTRQIEQNTGSITINGCDIRDISLDRLRACVSIVQQEPFLFSQSIAENISFGLQSLDQEKIVQAAKIADLTKDINTFPDSFETIIGERGITLSGGQRQRTALARSIAYEPDILILDDSLSAVDIQTERAIMSNLENIFRKKTVIIISHRVSTLKRADKIFSFSDGTIVEEGSHDELIGLNGIYAEINKKQQIDGGI